MIGTTLSHYRVLEQVGAGGMGVVYRARDERLNRDVALKVLTERPGDSRPSRGHLRHEALALSKLNHPNVAAVYDFDHAGDVDFLVMEFVAGRVLRDLIPPRGMVPADVVKLGIQLADGLTSAHEQGVIHCDLKPSNVRVDASGRPKILDFGLARLLEGGEASTRSGTDRQSLPGTLPYMSPEQVRGDSPDTRCDIYSLGAVLYEMATGQRLFRESRTAALLEAILHGEIVSLRALNPAVPPELDAVILKALDRVPGRRYQSAKEMGVDLRRLEPATAGSVSTSRVVAAPRRPMAALLAGLLVAALTGASVVHRVPPARVGMKLGVLPLRNLTGQPRVADWSMLAQSLLVGELTGIQDVGVLDPISVNALLDTSAEGTQDSELGMLRVLMRAGATLVVHGAVLPDAGGYAVQCRLLDPATGAALFTSSRMPVASEDELASAARQVSDELLAYIQLQVLRVPEDTQLRPWISLRAQKVQAVRAFWQASQYVLRDEQGVSEADLRRAIQFDPEFVAPRIWLISLLYSHQRLDEATAQYQEVLALGPTSNPFEQTMIGYVGALLARDREARLGHLETALKYSPGNFILLMNLADERAATGDCLGALESMRPAVGMMWPYPPLYRLWGACGIVAGRPDEARQVMEASLALKSVRPDPGVLVLLESLALGRGDRGEAARVAAAYVQRVRDLRRRLDFSDLLPACRHLAASASARGDHGAAAALLESVAARDPRAGGFQEALGDTYIKMGDQTRAREAYRRALDAYRTRLPHAAAADAVELAAGIRRLERLAGR